MPRAFNSVIQGPVQLRLEYVMWYPITSLGNLFQNLAVPTEYFLMKEYFSNIQTEFPVKKLVPISSFCHCAS